jgi:hypothetical protein
LRAVFVHLGANIPSHLKLNLERHKRLFPEIPATLGISTTTPLPKIPQEVEVFMYKRSSESIDLMKSLNLSPSFRDGFWHLTLERLFALSDIHSFFPSEPMVHVESDVLLMPNFPWAQLAAQRQMMWGKVTPTEDIAALLFSPSYFKTEQMVEKIIEAVKFNPNTNDMRSLHFASKSLPSTDFKYLPSGIDCDDFSGGFFDVATLGMWLTGMDPRNAWGKRRYLHPLPHHLVNPGSFNYRFQEGKLLVEREGTERKVFSLHIHSKDLRLFGPSWEDRLRKLVLSSNKRTPRTNFILTAFVRNLYEFTKEVLSRKALVAIRRKIIPSRR